MIVYRHATPEERRGSVRAQWINRIAPRRDRQDAGQCCVVFGRKHSVTVATGVRMAELLVDDRIASPDISVLVAELRADGIDPEIVGWVAYEDGKEVHFVCVPSGYGRRGIARSLMRRAGNLPGSWSTANGRALETAIHGKGAAA